MNQVLPYNQFKDPRDATRVCHCCGQKLYHADWCKYVMVHQRVIDEGDGFQSLVIWVELTPVLEEHLGDETTSETSAQETYPVSRL